MPFGMEECCTASLFTTTSQGTIRITTDLKSSEGLTLSIRVQIRSHWSGKLSISIEIFRRLSSANWTPLWDGGGGEGAGKQL